MIIALFLIGLAGITIALGLAFAPKAPIGYEDDNGFHYGSPTCLGSDASRTLFITDSLQNIPPEGVVTPPNLIRIQWMRPALGLAALFVMLLVLLPENQEKGKPITFSKNFVIPQAETPITQIPTAITSGESSRLVQKLCQRFDQVE